ncbi:hypothetical protein [Aequorivita echinoideorum]|uniref:Uncharacterized protein n=1 Tax=Aequorivita echinoideorum TaxID=1549647 RepID=A0ABS5S4J6_9FLAO|nr:hypothetical protein [Aequorivita echinoideorum]MBT0607335.1 hypothetical protein [Aequorivita echinoideorum]
MNKKWYFFGLLLALAFFGISLEQTAAPNQEIVVQFTAESITSEDAEETIAEITQQLKSIGIAEVQVSRMLDGKFKVTYFSVIDIAEVKGLFTAQCKYPTHENSNGKGGNSSKIPFSNTAEVYKLEVVKIQKNYASNFGFHGVPVEIKSLKDQYLNQYVSFGNAEFTTELKPTIERKIGKNYHYNFSFKTSISHKIPEVRAGPNV